MKSKEQFIHELRTQPRPIILTMHRGPKMLWEHARRFKFVFSAYPRAIRLLMEFGKPGDVMEIANARTGKQVGTIKLHVNGGISATWNKKEGDK